MDKTTASAQETKKLAQEFLKELRPPQVIALYGDLGSGKTTFVQGLAEGLGISQRLLSPTFIIHRIYPTSAGTKFHHLDLYRLEKVDASLGLRELFEENDSLVVVEWAEKIEALLPPKTIRIRFDHLKGDKRQISW
jgi:tRNA threonylcarbamoyladenosine biosynthesis protein TsaE